MDSRGNTAVDGVRYSAFRRGEFPKYIFCGFVYGCDSVLVRDREAGVAEGRYNTPGGQFLDGYGLGVGLNEVGMLLGDFFFRFRSRPIDELKFQQRSTFFRLDDC